MKSAFALAGALLLSGCGEEQALTKQEYFERGLSIRMDATEAGRLFVDLAGGDELSPAACERGTRRFRDEIERLVDDIDDVRPPEEVEAIHDRLVSAARETVDSLDELVDDVAAGEVACGLEWNRRAYGLDSTRRAQAELTELQDRGYQFRGQ